MTTFNIVKIIERYQLKPDVLAALLYPKAKHPGLAFTRILEGKAVLDVIQLERLARYIGVPPGDLFTVGEWQYRTQENYLTFVKDDFTVILNKGGYFLTILKGDEVIEQVVASNQALTLEQFIRFINLLTQTHKDGNSSESSN